MKWVDRPTFRVLDSSDNWEVKQPGKYAVDAFIRITIPSGFRTNFASVPRVFRSVISINGKHRLASLLHDYLYSREGMLPNIMFTRAAVDILFLEEMEKAEVKYIKRYTMYYMVRLFGRSRWELS